MKPKKKEALLEEEIRCPRGCPPQITDIGRPAKTLRWIFQPRNLGDITDVTGLPDPPFSNPRQENGDFLWDYAGDDTPDQVWPYELESQPPCPLKKDDDSQPQLTNGPG